MNNNDNNVPGERSQYRELCHCTTSALTNIERGTGHVIELRPPRQMVLPDPILEYERYTDPRRVVDARCRRDIRDGVEDDGRAQVLVPVIWPLLLPVPQRDGQEHADDDRVHLRVVYRRLAELPTWSNETPACADQT